MKKASYIKTFLLLAVAGLVSLLAYSPAHAELTREEQVWQQTFDGCYRSQLYQVGTPSVEAEKICRAKAGPVPGSSDTRAKSSDKSVVERGQRTKSYRAKFYGKCMDTYKNDARVASCCSTQADKETQALEKRGAFDTSTTAQLPIFVDESKCSIPEAPAANSRCDVYEGTQKISCNSYIAECLKVGKYPYLSEKSRGQSCVMSFLIGEPAELTAQEKYINLCISRGVARGESEDDIKGGCIKGYGDSAREYINRCIATNNNVEYSRANMFILRLRYLLNPGKYSAEQKACLDKYADVLKNLKTLD